MNKPPFYSAALKFELINALCKLRFARKLMRQCRRSGVTCLNVSPEQFREMSDTRRASGIAAILQQKWMNLNDVPLGQKLCWVLLETVRSPGNLGTLF